MTGPTGFLPRVGLSPTRPQAELGIRMEPPPSLAWAAGTIPAATTEADPPEDPPAVMPGAQGLLVAPCTAGSVTDAMPNSGVEVFPRMTRPPPR